MLYSIKCALHNQLLCMVVSTTQFLVKAKQQGWRKRGRVNAELKDKQHGFW